MKLDFKLDFQLDLRRKTILVTLSILIFFVALLWLGYEYYPEAFITDFTRKNLVPSIKYPFGTDWLGRNMLSRTLAGISLSVLIGLFASVISAFFAIILGIMSATLGKTVDRLISFLIDMVMGIPHILLLILISYGVGKGLKGVVIGIALTHWTSLARVIRGEVLQLKEQDYIKVALMLGNSKGKVAVKHMLPVILPQFLVGMVLMFPHAILHEASITFLGFGLSSEQPAIGIILSESMKYLVMGKWWLAVIPGLSLVVVVLLFTLLKDVLQRWINPNEIHGSRKHGTEKHGTENRRTEKSEQLGLEIDLQKGSKLNNTSCLLAVKDLSVTFTQYQKGMKRVELQTLRHLNFTMYPGEILAIVGASGSGKSLLAQSLLGLLPYNATTSGTMFFEGEALEQRRKEKIRGKKIAFVPQSTACLDSLMPVGRQIEKSIKGEAVAKRRAQLFERYGFEEQVKTLYPHECSGGMLRRVLLMTALMEEPKLIIADEPTPGMELELAKKTMEDFRDLASQGMGVLLITHDLELAIETAHRIAIFNEGSIIEEVATEDFQKGQGIKEPYTQTLHEALFGEQCILQGEE